MTWRGRCSQGTSSQPPSLAPRVLRLRLASQETACSLWKRESCRILQPCGREGGRGAEDRNRKYTHSVCGSNCGGFRLFCRGGRAGRVRHGAPPVRAVLGASAVWAPKPGRRRMRSRLRGLSRETEPRAGMREHGGRRLPVSRGALSEDSFGFCLFEWVCVGFFGFFCNIYLLISYFVFPFSLIFIKSTLVVSMNILFILKILI